MADIGSEKTDKLIDEMEVRLNEIYEQANKELKEKLDKYLKRRAQKYDVMQKKYQDGKITLEEFEKWAKGDITGPHYSALLDTLATDLTNTNQIAMSIVGEYLPEAYAINHNYAMYQLDLGGVDVAGIFTLYDRHTVEKLIREDGSLLPPPRVKIPEDKRWNRQHIRNALTQGVLQGESIPKISKRLENVVGMDKRAAVRNARTAMTGAQNAGRVASYRDAKKAGVNVMQEWLATHDGRTRESHLLIEGDRVEIGEEFSNGCEYPGDPDGPPEEVYNCRCTLIPYLPDYAFEESEVSEEGFEEWQEEQERSVEHFKPLDRQEMVNDRFTQEDADRIDERFRELDSIYHANVSDIISTLRRDQQEYDLYFENHVNRLLSENPRMRRSTAIRKATELLGERPVRADIFLGGDFNFESKVMTLNNYALSTSGGIKEDIAQRMKRIERNAMRISQGKPPRLFGNVGGTHEAAFIHEYGHAIDATYGISSNKLFLDYYRGLSKEDIERNLSSYAATNEKEFVAEAFCESFMGETQGEMSKEFMEILRRILP